MSSVLLSTTTGYATQMACEGSLENKGEGHRQGNDAADFQPSPARLQALKTTPVTMV